MCRAMYCEKDEIRLAYQAPNPKAIEFNPNKMKDAVVTAEERVVQFDGNLVSLTTIFQRF